jgi:hypothetical protein
MATINRVQTFRSSVKNQRPAAGSREAGELFVNFADFQIGTIDAAKNPRDLVAVRFFSNATDYSTGDFVFQAGALYRAKGAVTAGAFNASQWDALGTATDLALKENVIAPGTTSQYWRGDKSWQTLDRAAVGLANVDNTSDASKPVSTAQAAALAAKVSLAGDTMTGKLITVTPTTATAAITLPHGAAPTSPVNGDLWTTTTGIYGRVNGATVGPLGGAPDLSAYAPLASPTFSGDPKAPTPTAGDNDTTIATTAFVTAAIAAMPAGGGVTISDTAPGSPTQGMLWWQSSTGDLFISYNDGTSTQWIQVNTVGS